MGNRGGMNNLRNNFKDINIKNHQLLFEENISLIITVFMVLRKPSLSATLALLALNT